MMRLRAAAAALAVVGGVMGAIAVGGLVVVGCGDSGPGGPTEDGAADQTTTPPDVGVTVDTSTTRESGPDARDGGGADTGNGGRDGDATVNAGDGDATVNAGDGDAMGNTGDARDSASDGDAAVNGADAAGSGD